ncbi:MAG: hypothetical protein ACYSRR_06725, partial [Planctomycetota bacterium]
TTVSDDLILDDFDVLGSDKQWLRYTDVITDSNYFTPDFWIIIDTSLLTSTKEYICLDDVKVTKLTTTPVDPIISGYIMNLRNEPFVGAVVSGDNGGDSDVTDANGYYELTMPYGWSGTVEPNHPEYTFNPVGRTYTHVVIDHHERWVPDYKATSIYDFNGDGYINFLDYSVFALAWGSSLGEGNWNPACDFEVSLHIDAEDLYHFVNSWLE